MAANGCNSNEDTEVSDCDGEKVVTMMDVLQEQQDFEDDANAVLGASDDKNCTYLKGYVKRQAIYACLTCCPDAKHDEFKRAGVCLACSLNCHENHELVELYTKRNFRCDCGNPKFNSHPCQFTPNKTDFNDGNDYNQNFAGLYCVCHRPYPDPEALEEDDMIQCIICEDWLHSAHLESVVPPSDQYAEMVCKDCMNKNEFLHDYVDIAVVTENFDVDIVSANPEPSIVSVTTITNDKELFTEAKDLEQNGHTTDVEMSNDKQNGHTTDVEMSNDNLELSDEKVLRDIEAVLENKSSAEQITHKDTDNSKRNTTLEDNAVDNMDDRDISMDQEPNEKTELLDAEEDSLRNDGENKADEDIDNKNDQNCADQVKEDNMTPVNESNENVSLKSNDNDSSENQQKLNEIELIATDNTSAPNKENTIDEVKESNVDGPEDETEQVDKDGSQKIDVETSKELNKMTETVLNGPQEQTDQVDEMKTDLETSEGLNEINESNNITVQKEEVLVDKVVSPKVDSKELLNESNDNVSRETNDQKMQKEEELVDKVSSPKVDSEDMEELLNESNDNASRQTIDQKELVCETDKVASGQLDNIAMVEEESYDALRNESTQDIEVENTKTEGNNLGVIENGKAMNTNNLPEQININKAEESSNIEDCMVENGISPNGDSDKDLKRKFDEDNESEAKKLKLDNLSRREGCTRPIKNKKTLRGSTFWPSNFRQKLCTCNECISMYKDLSVLFLTDPEDTVTAYEMLGQEKTPSSQYERGLEALSSLDRVQQINALTEYNKMRDKLLDFLKSFKDRKEIVKEDDIKAFFAGMKPKREPDGVYFCR